MSDVDVPILDRWRRRATCWPIAAEAANILATGIRPAIRNLPIAARPAEAMHPDSPQTKNAVDQLLPSELSQFPQPKTSLDVVWMKCVTGGAMRWAALRNLQRQKGLVAVKNQAPGRKDVFWFHRSTTSLVATAGPFGGRGFVRYATIGLENGVQWHIIGGDRPCSGLARQRSG